MNEDCKLSDSGGDTWNLPTGEGVRQPIPALGGRAYPKLNVPAIREAREAPRKALDYVVNALLAAALATGVKISEEFRAALRERLE